MPPGKNFREIEQLSGGERTVAALALLFALHSFRPSPFFVLDEVDAALDNVNGHKVASYIQRRATGRHDLQAIVISLKDSFYERASGLVGICRDAEMNCSRSLTLDLTAFAGPAGAPGAAAATAGSANSAVSVGPSTTSRR
jgi:structural maintenance of chromosome 1